MHLLKGMSKKDIHVLLDLQEKKGISMLYPIGSL